MGSSKQTTTSTQNSRNIQQTVFDPRTQAEQRIMNDYTSLGQTQSDFLRRILNGGQGLYNLSEPDQQRLDQSYQSAFDRFNLEGKDYADYLASTRGLNKSDTPVSQQAMQRYGMGMADLLSQKANAGLNLGFQGNMARLNATGMTPAGLNAAFAPMYNERMAGGTTTSTGSGSSTQTTRSTPSVMQQIQQGAGLAAGLGMMAGGAITGNPMLAMGGMNALNGQAASMGGMGGMGQSTGSSGGLGSWLGGLFGKGMGTGLQNSGSSYGPNGVPLPRYGFNSAP